MRNTNIPATATTVGLKARWSMNFLLRQRRALERKGTDAVRV